MRKCRGIALLLGGASIEAPRAKLDVRRPPTLVRVRRFILVAASVAIAVGCAEHPAPPTGSAALPLGWIAVTPPATDTPALWCANYAEDEWEVSLNADSTAVLFSAAAGVRGVDSTSTSVSDGVIAGNDLGEFGGAIWWSGRSGRRDTLDVEDRDSSTFAADNVHGFLRRRGSLYALVGLAHLTLDAGELLYLSQDSAGRWHARHVMSLGGSPEAYALMGSDSALVLLSDSLLAVKFDPVAPTRRALYGDPAWGYTYASSILRDRAGIVYIGMRSAVARLTPSGRGYHEDWLVPERCRRRVPVGRGEPCRCEPGA